MLGLLYFLTFLVPVPFWVMIILFPRRKVTEAFFGTSYSYSGFLILGALYVFVLIGGTLSGISTGLLSKGGFGGPDDLAVLFSSPSFALLVWLHMVTMDLAGGFYIYRESLRLHLPVRYTSLILFLTLLLGPIGMFSFGLWRVLTGMRSVAVTAHKDVALEPVITHDSTPQSA